MSSTASTAGAQTQISAFGLANVFVNTRKPRATLWRTEHTPMSHFAYADVRVEHNGNAQFGGRMAFDFDRPADLIGEVNLRYTLRAWVEGATAEATHGPWTTSNNFFYTEDVGFAQLENVELVIGNNRFDVFDGTYLHILDEITMPEGRQTNLLTGRAPDEQRMEYARFDQDLIIPITSDLFNIPGKALESVAIHKQKIRLNITNRPLAQLIRVSGAGAVTAYDLGLTTPADANAVRANGGSNELQDCHLQVHYIWVTAGERSIILSVPSYTLYRECQKIQEITKGASDFSIRQRLSLNNIVHDLFFVCRLNSKWDLTAATERGYNWFDFSGLDIASYTGNTDPRPPFATCSLQLNNTQRFQATPNYLESFMQRNHYARSPQRFIYTYAFARHPVDADPSGGLNMSMIDHQDFQMTFDAIEGAWDGVILPYARAWQLATRDKGVLHKELASQ